MTAPKSGDWSAALTFAESVTLTARKGSATPVSDPTVIADDLALEWQTADELPAARFAPMTLAFTLAANRVADLPPLALGSSIDLNLTFYYGEPAGLLPGLKWRFEITDVAYDLDPRRRRSARATITAADPLAALANITPEMATQTYPPRTLGYWHALAALGRVSGVRVEYPAAWPLGDAYKATPRGQYAAANLAAVWPEATAAELFAALLATPPEPADVKQSCPPTFTLMPRLAANPADGPPGGYADLDTRAPISNLVRLPPAWDGPNYSPDERVRFPTPATRTRYLLAKVRRELTQTAIRPPNRLTASGGYWQTVHDPLPDSGSLFPDHLTVLDACEIVAPATAAATRRGANTVAALSGEVVARPDPGEPATRETGVTEYVSPAAARFGLAAREVNTLLETRNDSAYLVETRAPTVAARTAEIYLPATADVSQTLVFADPLEIALETMPTVARARAILALFPSAEYAAAQGGWSPALAVAGLPAALGSPGDRITGSAVGGQLRLSAGRLTMTVRLAPGLPAIGPGLTGPITFSEMTAAGITFDKLAPDSSGRPADAIALLLTRN